MSAHLLLDLAAAVGRAAEGTAVTVRVDDRDGAELAARWCSRAGHRFVAWDGRAVSIRRGRAPITSVPDELHPARRIWIYTNFDCNLACAYCCVSSSPRTPRRALDLATIERVACEAPAVGARELYLTGGEPFLLPNIADVVAACSAALPTVVLTNGMLFRGARLAALDAMTRDRVTLQISVDSATAARHDAFRGAGSHARALAGVATAQALGFHVRLAATVADADPEEEAAFGRLCDTAGIAPRDRLIRRVARQGAAGSGVVVTRASLAPEVCVTADGVSWHPVAATDPAMRVTDRVVPLADAVRLVVAEYAEHRERSRELALTFPCA